MKKKVLIVEDEVIIRRHLVKVARRCDCEIIGEVDSGEDAVNIAESLSPDLIFMDIHLSGKLNGYETAKKINNKKEIPIIFLSANSYIVESIKKDSKGFVEFINKPVCEDTIKSLFNKIFKE